MVEYLGSSGQDSLSHFTHCYQFRETIHTMAETYTLSQVVSVARVHPFYCPDVEYPPLPEAVRQIASKNDSGDGNFDLNVVPLITKDELFVLNPIFKSRILSNIIGL